MLRSPLIRGLVLPLLTFALLAPPVARAREAKTYQVTGKVLEVSDDLIVVDKSGEKFEIGRDKDTKIDGELKVGSKVTVHYRMSAASVEAKDSAK
jgi:hypothetical protein